MRYSDNQWDIALSQILDSSYVRIFVRDVLANIKKGEHSFTGLKGWGFGEGYYYKTKRSLLIDAITQFIEYSDEETISQSPMISDWVVQNVREELEGNLPCKLNDVYENIGSNFGKDTVRVEADINAILGDATPQLLKRLSHFEDSHIEDMFTHCYSEEDLRICYDNPD